MSRHFFNTEHNVIEVTVQIGFDRPCSGFYMVVHEREDDSLGDIIYSNLYEANPHPDTVSPFLEKLNELGIAPLTEAVNKQTEIVGNLQQFIGVSLGKLPYHQKNTFIEDLISILEEYIPFKSTVDEYRKCLEPKPVITDSQNNEWRRIVGMEAVDGKGNALGTITDQYFDEGKLRS